MSWLKRAEAFNQFRQAVLSVIVGGLVLLLAIGVLGPASLGVVGRYLFGGDVSGPASLNPSTPPLSIFSKQSTRIYVMLAAGSGEGSQALLVGMRDDLSNKGFQLAASTADADLVCEVSGIAIPGTRPPGQDVAASLVARWKISAAELYAHEVTINGIGSRPDLAASRAYRNAASALSDAFEASIKDFQR